MVVFFLTWKPNSIVADSGGKFNEMADDEFENYDEFSADEFSNESFTSKNKMPVVEEIGLFFYEEFGSVFYEYKYYSGLFATFVFWEQWN